MFNSGNICKNEKKKKKKEKSHSCRQYTCQAAGEKADIFHDVGVQLLNKICFFLLKDEYKLNSKYCYDE